ncbi:DnaJ domain-containing protein [Gongronella butleri]|nr:DnaJ domain-containing protein [Gongronella butleri]
MQKASNLRNRGNDLFKLGYYREAEVSYTQALAMLPARHHLTALISNNRAAARLKVHQHRQCVLDCTTTIDWAREQLDLPGNNGGALSLLVDGELINIKWHDQLVKALTRKADALEQMGRQTEAAAAYQELITADPANTRAKDGLARCRNPSAAAPAASSATGATTASTAFPGLDYSIFEKPPVEEEEPKSEAVRAMRERQKKKAEEDRERLLKQDVVNTRIDAWKRGKEKNIRALLTTLDTLMWPAANWRGVTTAELLEPKKVKVTYMRAIAKVHPDKLSADASVEQQLLATSIFAVLNQAWDTFRSNNVM